ncbi:hypothetical protein [Streptomyces sp. NPDC090025]|uniref:hypothetical protein n=1 Tax=Streptomyces sp. NPDC090025 TaxID=3365922 RepID=UPI0038329E7E
MSIISALPIVQGNEGAVVVPVSDGLILERPHEEVTIPFAAMARVRAEERCLIIELRARAGAEPVLHRLDDVTDPRATALADGVNALLTELATDTEPGTEVDGAALAFVRSRGATWSQRFMRRVTRWMLGFAGAVVAASVLIGFAGDAAGIALLVPIGGITIVGLWIAVPTLGAWNHERHLMKHGTTVLARPATSSGTYLFTDPAGTTRAVPHLSSAPYVKVSHDPGDPTDAYPHKDPGARRFDLAVGSLILFCALCGLVMVVWTVFTALTGDRLSQAA